MDYEKAYKEALERAKKFRSPFCQVAAETIFPELKESEDEKIRNFLIDFIKACGWSEKQFPPREDCISWLEKQGEQKHDWSEEDKAMIDNIIWGVHMKFIQPLDEVDDRNKYKKYEDFLKSLPKRFNLQSKQEWNAQDEAFLGDAIYAAKKTYSENCGQEELIDWLKSLKPQNHWKPSEEQMQALF